MAGQRHKFILEASRHWWLCQWLGLVLLMATSYAWPAHISTTLWGLLVLGMAGFCGYRLNQLWRGRGWRVHLSLGDDGCGDYRLQLPQQPPHIASDDPKYNIRLRPTIWVCPWFCCFAIATTQGRQWVWVFADMLPLATYRCLCRLLIAHKKAPAGA
ncbi:protein YgfX [Shewanella sp. NIFS-20-20]|uniref:protein YgfX n=1 Tax=Shewanella sp. NIFS-20-20 TaxID=2853806 RepID=UPI001C49380A|nr:protein YgfX [Shewanella sp. NIFS-20-20]MBV7314237.1 hypothetical protein [Shewanella sp. NIFS-20-20]